MRPGKKMSRRTAGWLMAIAAALVIFHFTQGNQTSNLWGTSPVTAPVTVSLNGEITGMQSHTISLQLVDAKGNLSTATRTIQVGNQTRIEYPGSPPQTGVSGMSLLRTGFRVAVQGQSQANGIDANTVSVKFPPLVGTVEKVQGSDIQVNVAGQSVPIKLTITPATKIQLPTKNGSNLTPGEPVKIAMAPNLKTGGFTVFSIAVQAPPASGS